MKRAVFIFIILCLLLPGCISPAEFTADPSSQSRSSSETEVCFPDYVYDPEEAMYYSHNYAAVREDGYYLVINNVLHFYDIQSDMLFPLCTKESCLHMDNTCDAYCFQERNRNTENYKNGLAANAYNYWITYHGDQLYTIGVHPDKGRVLFQYSRDFAEQREIVWLEDFEKAPDVLYVDQSLFLHGQYAYYATWLYQEDKVQQMDYETVCTVHRVNLEGKAEPEELFSFDSFGLGGFRTLEFEDELYFIYEQEVYRILSDEERKDSSDPIQLAGWAGKVFRYDEEKNQVEQIWSYDGDEPVSLFEAEGTIPRNMHSTPYLFGGGDYLVNTEGDYVYLAGYSETGEDYNLLPTSIAAVNLKTREGKVLYETPYIYIQSLVSDGEYYYFIEQAERCIYLTAINRDGNLIRRYEIPLDEEFIKDEEERGEHLKERLARAETEEDRERLRQALEELKIDPGNLRLLITDGRYISLAGFGGHPVHKNLSSRVPDNSLTRTVDDGVGVINADDFLSGKDVGIRQIYERMIDYGG